jgi:hypothetical protein
VPGIAFKERRMHLRKDDPVLYLHLSYRNPNQFLIARFDGMRDLKQNIKALEKLEHGVFTVLAEGIEPGPLAYADRTSA